MAASRMFFPCQCRVVPLTVVTEELEPANDAPGRVGCHYMGRESTQAQWLAARWGISPSQYLINTEFLAFRMWGHSICWEEECEVCEVCGRSDQLCIWGLTAGFTLKYPKSIDMVFLYWEEDPRSVLERSKQASRLSHQPPPS